MNPNELKYIQTCADAYECSSIQKVSTRSIRELLVERAELLEALELYQIRVFMAEGSENAAYQAAGAAIAKAKGEL